MRNDAEQEHPGRNGPIALRDMGAFHAGGRIITLDGMPVDTYQMAQGAPLVTINRNGSYHVEQMYAQYFFPAEARQSCPLQFWHGGGMTGAAWETTPDGRPGWLHYFLRRGWNSYLCDAVERGRSGFAPVPQVWPDAPIIQTAESILERFRIDYPDTQFPRSAFDALAAQMVPRWVHTDAAMLSGYHALLQRTGPSALISHSQAGMLALRMAHSHPELVRAVVALEPASTPDPVEHDGPNVPTLIVLGDHIEEDARWPENMARIRRYAQSRPNVTLLWLPELGIRGNSHMLMMDRNSLDVADLVHDWLARTMAGTD